MNKVLCVPWSSSDPRETAELGDFMKNMFFWWLSDLPEIDISVGQGLTSVDKG